MFKRLRGRERVRFLLWREPMVIEMKAKKRVEETPSSPVKREEESSTYPDCYELYTWREHAMTGDCNGHDVQSNDSH